MRRVFDLGDLLLFCVHTDCVQGQCGCLVLDLQRVLIHPHLHLFTSGQAVLSEELPVLELHISLPVNLAGKVRGVQGAREYLFRDGMPQ